MTVNERVCAVHIMERFVRMSRLLLPSYYRLMSKNSCSVDDKAKIERITQVYESFKASPSASEYLINSNIIELIQRFYYQIKHRGVEIPDTQKALAEFIEESDRLINTWDYSKLN